MPTIMFCFVFQEPNKDTNTLPVISNDCGKWPPKINDEVRKVLVERGPQQVTDKEFPADSKGRKFSSNHYTRKLCNGEQVHRNWVLYSISKNAAFCFPCKLFGNTNSLLASDQGYSDWQNLHKTLTSHEKSSAHVKNCTFWRELSVRLRLNKTIDEEHERLIHAETEHWHQVLKRLLCIVQFLGTQGLAFRGKKDVLFERNNGNFLKLVEHIAKFDVFMAEHVRRINSKETHVHYLSKNIQSEFILFLSAKIQDKILQDLQQATYYSIILDCTPDVSHTEQMTFVIRFVKITENEDVLIKEHFLGFIPIKDSSGEGLTEALLKELKERGIPLKNMRGQGYDNGSAMKGKHVGVQKRILDLNPRAFYVPCGNHSLNLVINDAALSCNSAVDCFSTIQEIYNFFSSSTQRWSILLKNVSSLTVKPLCNTRWESRIEALLPLRYHIEEVYDALYEASQDKNLDAFGRHTAVGLVKKLQSFKFLCCIVTWHEILYKTNMVSKLMQKVTNDLQSSIDLLKSVKSFFETMRSEEGLNSVITDAKELAEKIDVAGDFEQEKTVRPRRVKKQFSYESEDEAASSGKDLFKVNFFFVVLDRAISSLKERFELMENHSEGFKFLYDIASLGKAWSESELKKACKHLETVLSGGDGDDKPKEYDINGDELFDELQIFGPMLPPRSHPAGALSFITKRGYVDTFPNIFVALRILLTLPVSVASGERSFSKLKLIKTYLRSNLSQEHLSGLATLAIENDALNEMETDILLQEFSKLKARRIPF